MRVAAPIEIDAQSERRLRALSRGRRVEARVQQRARLVLLAAQGWTNKDIADEVRLDRRQVSLWRNRYLDGGVDALLQDASRPGRKPSVTAALEWCILRTTLCGPRGTSEHWSTRSLAAHLDVSPTTVRRVWQRNGITPPVQDRGCASFGTRAVCKASVDVVGLYAGPHARVLVLACDERHPPRCFNRARPAAPDRLAPHGTRQGAGALLSAIAELHAAAGGPPRHGRSAWFKWWQRIDVHTPGLRRLHVVVEGRAEHARAIIEARRGRQSRVVLHRLPADRGPVRRSGRILRELVAHHNGPRCFNSVHDLLQAISRHVNQVSDQGPSFFWPGC